MAWIRLSNGGRRVINTELIKTVETILVSTSPNTWSLRVALTTGDSYQISPTFTVRDEAEAIVAEIVSGEYHEA